jgi:hypothetical protein
MTTQRAYYEYVTITYNPLDPDEVKWSDELMEREDLEFRSRRPKVGKIVLVGRREITPPEKVEPMLDNTELAGSFVRVGQ